MNDNLAEMIKEETVESQTFNEEDLNIPEEVTEVAEEVAEEVVEEEEVPGVKTAMLCDWFEANHENFQNVGPVKAAIRGVNSRKRLIIAADIKGSTLEDGTQERNLFIFDEADTYPVLDLTGTEMEIFGNGIKINYDYDPDQNIYLKTYGIRSGLFVISCNKVDDLLIPYNVSRLKKKDKNLVIDQNPNIDNISAKLDENVDTEELQVKYKPISKNISDITTVRSAVTWFLNKQADIYDVNHLLKIDNIIIDMFS